MKRALLIGINYKGTDNELSGCTDDVKRMIPVLTRSGYTNDNILVLSDDSGDISPTTANILRSFGWLLGTSSSSNFNTQNAGEFTSFRQLQQNGQRYYFHYSGHGTYCTKCRVNFPPGVSRADAICPLDFSEHGLIYDNTLRQSLVDKLSKNDILIAILDCCYSGTELDLSWSYDEKTDGVVKVNDYMSSVGFACSLSGCTDYQTSEVVKIGDKFEGALSYAFLKAYSSKTQSYQSLISDIRSIISRENLSAQTPNLHFGYQIDPNLTFTL